MKLAIFLLQLGVLVAMEPDAHADVWQYSIGPFEFKSYPDLTKTDNPLTGRIWGRINTEMDQIDFKYEMDNADQHPEFFPIFAMHVHHGLPTPEETGHVILSIAGKDHIWACLSAKANEDQSFQYQVCSDKCAKGNYSINCRSDCPPAISAETPEAQELLAGLVLEPAETLKTRRRLLQDVPATIPQICNLKAGGAYACEGGCDGDSRGTHGNQALAPSRYCDNKDVDSTSDAPQHYWLSAKYSHEMSGNETDGKEYSKWSIFKKGNFDKFCGTKIHFLKEMLSAGDKSYVALHLDFNATGTASLDYGDIHAIINDGSGVEIKDKHGQVVKIDLDEKDPDEMIYELGPFELSDYPELTGHNVPVKGRFYGRINRAWDRLDVKLEIDEAEKWQDSYFPIFAVHVHHGSLEKKEVGGHVMITIAGKGDITGCWSAAENADGDIQYQVCSPKCLGDGYATNCRTDCPEPALDFNMASAMAGIPLPTVKSKNAKGPSPLGPYKKPDGWDAYMASLSASAPAATTPATTPAGPAGPGRRLQQTQPSFPQICNLPLGFATGCNGGCLGDERPGAGSFSIAPSRYCDALDSTRDSNMELGRWYTTKMSHELSGNSVDGHHHYDPFSMTKRGNFDRFCGVKLRFLKKLVSAGEGSYIALHLDFNATGTASTDTGDVLASLNDGSGTEVREISTGKVCGKDDFPEICELWKDQCAVGKEFRGWMQSACKLTCCESAACEPDRDAVCPDFKDHCQDGMTYYNWMSLNCATTCCTSAL